MDVRFLFGFADGNLNPFTCKCPVATSVLALLKKHQYNDFEVNNVDGYIKNKNEAIAFVRRTIMAKYATTVLIVLLIPFWLLALAANQNPEKWTHTEILFSHISQEHIGLQRGRRYVLNSQDGRQFVINSKYVDIEDLSDNLVQGSAYYIVFSNTIAGGAHMLALYDENVVFQDLDHSIARWENEQQEMIIAIIVTLFIEAAALVLIDRLWCKKEYSQIRKLKADIKRREDRIMKK